MILIGSRALSIRAPHLLMGRSPKDFDWICTQEEYQEWMEKNSHKVNPTKIYSLNDGKKQIVESDSTPCEFEIIQPGTSNEMFAKLIDEDKETIDTPFGKIPSLNALFTLKDSHKYLKNSPYVFKTLVDWHAMRNSGAVIPSEYELFSKLRQKETYNYKLPSLTNQSKESFFSAAHGVEYVYDHDSLHMAVKHLDLPAYCYYAKDNDPIKSDKTKFFAVDHQIRLYGAIEESSVLAIERALVPSFDKWKSIDQAWKFAFSKVITSITSGFFRQWCYENAFEILKAYPTDFYEKFQKGLANGTVKLATSSNSMMA
jgi:hypothetical protein